MSIDLTIKKYLTDNENTAINSLFTDRNGIIFQEPIFNEIVSTVFHTKLNHYLIYDTNDLIAYCAGHLTNNRILTTIQLKPLHDIPYGGFINKNIDFPVEDLLSFLPHKRTYKYIYSSTPLITNQEYHTAYQNFTRRETAVIDLSLSEDRLWESVINSKRRNMIRKAKKEGITAVKLRTQEGLKSFWPILNKLHINLGHHDLSYMYYQQILNYYFKENKAVIILAIKNEEVISGVIIIGNKYMMHYWKGASKEGVKNEGQGDLLQWEAIKYAKNNGVKYYDLCVVDFKNLAHIAKFKMGFAKITIPFYIKSYSSLFYKVVNRIQNVF